MNNIGKMCTQAGLFLGRVNDEHCEALRMYEAALDSAVAGYGVDHTARWLGHT